jgi:hypothetical protein
MGRIARVLDYLTGERNGSKLAEVKVDPGGGANQTDEHFTNPGIDAAPLNDDWEVAVDIERSGGTAAVGYIDPKNEHKAARGEIRIYARKADGSAAVEFWLKSDGSTTWGNDAGGMSLGANGTFNINGVEIDPSGNIKTPDGKTLNNHKHLYQDTGAAVNPSTTQENI